MGVVKRFETVSVPVELLEEIESVVEQRKNGYTSVAEFVRGCCEGEAPRST